MRDGSIETCSLCVARVSRDRSFRGAILAVTIVAVLLVMAAADVRTVSAQFGGRGFFPYGRYGGYGMAGTAQSAAEFGLASVIAARGYADLQHSVAARNYLALRSQDFDNRLQWTRAYYDMRREHRAYVSDHTRLSMDEITKIASDAAPKRSMPRSSTRRRARLPGRSFCKTRAMSRSPTSWRTCTNRAIASNFVGAENYQNINKTCEDLLNLLKANIDEYQPNDFIQARRFIESLRYESRFPTS